MKNTNVLMVLNLSITTGLTIVEDCKFFCDRQWDIIWEAIENYRIAEETND
jgi:hypothetical protein